jgi:type III secretion protein Q
LATVNETLFFEYADGQAAEGTRAPGAESELPVVKAPTLARRLRRLAPTAAVALRDLFQGRECLVLDGDPETTWRFAPAQQVHPPAAILDGAYEQLAMSVSNDGWCEALGARAWWDFTGESRLLAWALAHSGLLEGFGRMLREPLMPSALTDGPLLGSDTTVALDFSATTADGRTTTGCVSMSAAMVVRLATHAGWRRTEAIAPGWLTLPATLCIRLCGVVFPLSVLSASETGDVWVLGNRADCWRKLQVVLVSRDSDLQKWNACYDGTRLSLTAGKLNPATELIMSDPKTAGAADNIPVSLDFELGNLALPLGELATLKPGYVFELPGSLEKVRVAICSNGTRVGQGELVAVGDVLGVQLVSLDVDGLR